MERDRKAAFLEHVREEDSGCWLWTGPFGRGGYGTFKHDRRRMSAHRAAYEIFTGTIPPGEGHHGTCVLHTCDVPHCVNPAHLFLGTVQDNNADMVAKGRQSRRENKTTRRDRQVICERYLDGESQNALAREYGVSQARISYIVRCEGAKLVPQLASALEARRRCERERQRTGDELQETG